MASDVLDRWTIENSDELYGVSRWGSGYFSISSEGEVVVTPFNNKSVQVSIMNIISSIRDRGIEMPVLLRFENLLDSQIVNLNESFRKAMDQFSYKGTYRGVFPVKVNQQQQVVEEVNKFGRNYHHGLEVGSKGELMIALAYLNDPEACLICNGYKDEEFIDLALSAQKMGVNCFLVIEMPDELTTIMKRAEKLQITPQIGVRIKLSSKAGGHWTESGGDRSVFGLSTIQLVEVIDQLKEKNMLSSLKLLHYHLGSQIPNIRDIRSAIVEACRIYAELIKEGAPMGFLDLGGGLAVDYDGSKTNYQNSMNYSIDEYCTDIIEVLMGILDENNIAHPTLITESGRYIVAYYSILLTNVLDVSRFETAKLPEKIPENQHEYIESIFDVYKTLNQKNVQECYNDALYYRDEIRQLFKHGEITLRERSFAENIFWNIINKIAKLTKNLKHIPPEIEGIDVAISDIYYLNFSVFQSLPDTWAIDHMFPIIPLHRLNQPPVRNAIISDITCDCDGKIDRFIDNHDVRYTLPLHELNPDEEYYIGAFLVGAYQETLGDLHNLMGDTNVISIRIKEDGSYDVVKEIEGDSVCDVLTYVEYDPKNLIVRFKENAENAVKNGLLTMAERRDIIRAYEDGMRGYTYFER